LQAALDGYGVALGRHVLAADDLAAGRLVELFPGPRLPARFAYYVVASKANWERPKVLLLRQWLKEEAAAAVAGLARGSQAEKA
ncbi:MAG: LysR substrate-binding domain-containing protein, partial [Kiloniellales bacterium]